MAAAETARLIASLELQDKNFTRGLKQVERGVGRVDKKLGAFSGAINRTAVRAIDNLVSRAADVPGAVINAAVEQETAITGIAKTINGDISAVVDDLKRLSTETGSTFTELAGIAELGGAMGIAKDDVAAFTEQVAILGATTDVSVEDAATALGQLQNVIGLTGDEFDNFAATLVDLGNKGASTESQILEIAKRTGAAAKLFHIGKAETLGWASSVANLGLEAEAGGTALASLFQKSLPLFLKGNKTIQKVTGLTAKELKRAFEKDASGALQSFIADLGELSEGDRLAAIQKLYGKNSALTKILLGLSGDTDNLTESVETGTKAWKEATAAQVEADKRFATSEFAFKRLNNSIGLMAATVGTELLPVLTGLAEEGIAWLNEPATQKNLKNFAKGLGEGVRGLAGIVRSIDWGSIAGFIGTAAGFAGDLVGWFAKMPGWAQAFLVGGFAATKLPVIGGLITDLGKGLIKGVLGMNAGVVNINAGVVNGAGVPGAGGGVLGKLTKGGGLFGGLPKGGLGALLGITGVGLAAALASEFEDEISGLGASLGDGWRSFLRSTVHIDVPKIDAGDLEWPFGPKNTPAILPEVFGGNGLLGGTRAAPAPTRGGDRPSPGNPGIVKGQLEKAITPTKQAITNAIENAKSIASRENSAQKTEIVNAKNAAATAGRNTSTAVRGTTSAVQSNAATVAASMTAAATRIVGAVNSLDLSVNVTTVNRTSTINNRYGPSGGSATTNRTYSGQ